MSKVERYTQKAIDIANDDKHGYSQYNRWGNPDYDCSSLVITVIQDSGIPVKTSGATYTGNMYNAFIKNGFEDVTHTTNLTTGQGLKRGDVLLNVVNHTEIYIGSGKSVGARSSETGTIHGVGGDQTGQEICVSNYYDYPWNYVLRYKESYPQSVNNVSNGDAINDFARDVLKGKYGNGNARKENIYKTVQNEVKVILSKGNVKNNYITVIANDVIKGKYGNGNARKENIYKTVQNEVNKLV